MKIHRFYIPHIEMSAENLIVIYETELIHQLKNVFRYKIGQIIHIFNETAGEMEVEISKIDKKDMSFKYIRQIKAFDNNIQSKKVTLYMSIIKNSNFDLIVEKAVELGTSSIIPVISERVIKNKLNYERLNKIIKEATEQSGRVSLMKIGETISLTQAVVLAKENTGKVYFGATDVGEGSRYSADDKDKNISIFIGPEGGYSESEIELFKKQKIQPIRLGDYVLRAETAAIVACGLLSL
jgi:16S rRNA (uracil1498-N3)-methyltransferase